MQLLMIHFTALFKAVLDVVMAVWRNRWIPLVACLLNWHQRAANILVSFLKLYMIKKKSDFAVSFFIFISFCGVCVCVGGCKYAPVFVCTVYLYVGKCMEVCVHLCITVRGLAASITRSPTDFE